ncbi:MAG: hypothetical protein R2824_23265 [Saprospiraceae bacterium]|nr:hypothetical protein [Lewinella sp.]
MAFNSLQNRIWQLPILICGPIVRKTVEDEVSVWVACKESCELTLNIYDTSGTTILQNVVGTNSIRQKTLEFGKHLHVAVITAKPVNDSNPFLPDKIYAYDIYFQTNDGSPDRNLNTREIFLGGLPQEGEEGQVDYLKDKLTYGGFKLPTFCLPSKNIDFLKIVHGSCRKPHGGRTDAFRGLDNMLELWAQDIQKRPQILCLTGDQIYADDVADLMLKVIIDASQAIIGWEEKLPNGMKATYKTNTLGEYVTPSLNAGKGKRKNLVAKTGQLGVATDDLTTSAENHLVFLAEFYMMYLLVWSDTLWDSNFLKDSSDSSLTKETRGLKIFHKSLPFIRRALANIATYMIFDDHEITDDWFLTARWSEKALKKDSLSRRIIQNGLAAYAVFQAWGNTPNRFVPGTQGGALFTNLIGLGSNFIHLPYDDLIGELILPKLEKRTSDSNIGERFILKPGKIKWHFHIDFDVFRLVFLDCRTLRGYHKEGYSDCRISPMSDKMALKSLGYRIKDISDLGPMQLYLVEDSKEGYPALISSEMMNEQLVLDNTGTKPKSLNPQKSNQKFLLVVSPTPLYGNIQMELNMRRVSHTGTYPNLISQIYPGMYDAEQEAWVVFPEACELFIKKLSAYNKILILSGDVHYGFTVRVTPNTPSVAVWSGNSVPQFINLTSSALKNSSKDTTRVAYNQYGLFAPKLIYPNQRIHDIKFTYNYGKDSRKNRITILPNELIGNKQYEALKLKKKLHDGHDLIVGKDNIGEVSFEDLPNLSYHLIVHNLWWSGGKSDKSQISEAEGIILPFTKHEKFLFYN